MRKHTLLVSRSTRRLAFIAAFIMLLVAGAVHAVDEAAAADRIGRPADFSASWHGFAIRSGQLWSWGNNCRGQLGNGTTANAALPARVGTANDWTCISSSGDECSWGIRGNGTLWGWGKNDDGQLGDGTTQEARVPVQIGTDTGWASVAAGVFHTLALKSDGSLYAWGDNADGRVGDGSVQRRSVPVLINDLSGTNWAVISAGQAHSAAVKRDGTLWTWGFNFWGQLGTGDTNRRTVPTQIGGGSTDWASVAAGGEHTLALKTNGELWACGSNYFRALGIGSSGQYTTLQRVGSDSDWVAVAAAQYTSFALKSNGTLWSWGSGYDSELGTGTTFQSSPRQVGTATDWVAISAMHRDCMARKADGTLWAWGDNTFGQSGSGASSGDQAAPVQVVFPAAPTPVATSLTLIAPSFRWDQTSRLSGRLTDDDGAGIAAAAIVIERAKSGSSVWTQVATATSASDGTWAYQYDPSSAFEGNHQVRVRYQGQGDTYLASSATASILARVSLSTPTKSVSSPRAGRVFALRGYVGPRFTARSCPATALIYKRRANGSYALCKTVKLKALSSSGTRTKMAVSTRLVAKGSYKVRFSFRTACVSRGGQRFTRTYSPYHSFRVR